MGPTPDWRPLVAALNNAHAREVFAQIVLGHDAESLGQGLGAARRRGVLASLVSAGLVIEDAGRFEVRQDAFAKILAARSGPEPVRGPERFLDGTGMIDRYPRSDAELRQLLTLVAHRVLDPGEVLSEAEMNGRLRVFSRDVALLRRLLVDHAVVARTRSGSEYALG